MATRAIIIKAAGDTALASGMADAMVTKELAAMRAKLADTETRLARDADLRNVHNAVRLRSLLDSYKRPPQGRLARLCETAFIWAYALTHTPLVERISDTQIGGRQT